MKLTKSLVFIFVGVLAFLISCSSIKYEDDLGFLNSAQANSFEFPVTVNNLPCKDMAGKFGHCALKITDKQGAKILHEIRPYAYRLVLRCSSGVDQIIIEGREYYLPLTFDAEKLQRVEVIIPAQSYESKKSFSCIGEIFPNDRDEQVSAKYQINFSVRDHKYQERESIYLKTKKKKQYLVLGKHAKYVSINGELMSKEPVRKVKSTPKFAFSESYTMRFNYYEGR